MSISDVVIWYKRFVYHVTLAFGYCMNKLFPQYWPAYNKITENLYLGRLPLKNTNDHNTLQKEGVGAILSLVETFENHSQGIFTTPVTPEDWKVFGIDQLQIETPDFQPLSVASFQKAVAFIESQVQQGKKVYVHCKAGRSRSAAAVVAYLVKNHPGKFSSVQECTSYVKRLRPLITLHHDKIKSIEAYLQWVFHRGTKKVRGFK